MRAVWLDTFGWKRILSVKVIALPPAESTGYVEGYGDPDKSQTGLGAGSSAWQVPYWTIVTSMAVMSLLLAAEDAGLGALFFGVFRGERELRQEMGIPNGLELLGAIALGHPLADTGDAAAGRGRSAGRGRRAATQIIHRSHW